MYMYIQLYTKCINYSAHDIIRAVSWLAQLYMFVLISLMAPNAHITTSFFVHVLYKYSQLQKQKRENSSRTAGLYPGGCIRLSQLVYIHLHVSL